MSRTYGSRNAVSSSSRQRSPSPVRERERERERRRERDRDRDRDDDRERRREHRRDRDRYRDDGKRRRRRASDDEEDATAPGDRDIEQLLAQSSAITFAQHKARRAREANDNDESEAGGDEDEDPRFAWTAETFVDQPVGFRAARAELTDARNRYEKLSAVYRRGTEQIIENARDLETVSPDHDEIGKLQNYLLAMIGSNHELEIRLSVIKTLLDDMRAGAKFEDLQGEIQRRGDPEVQAWKSQTLRQRYKDNELLIEFRTAVWNVNHEDEPLPPMTRWLGREGDDESDDELEYGGTIQTYRCPISLTHLVDAYKSTKCGHHYSHAAIMNHIASSGQRRGAKCPVGACTAIITRADLLRDERMQKAAEAFVARQRRREQENEEEVDEV